MDALGPIVQSQPGLPTIKAVGFTEQPPGRGQDMALIERMRLGDSHAIETFCQEYGQVIARYSRRFAESP